MIVDVESHRFQRRGATLIFAMVSLVLMFGFAALAIDGGRLYLTRVELQAAADSAALAGVSGYATDAGLQQDHDALQEVCFDRASEFSARNKAMNSAVRLAEADFQMGTHDFDNPSAALD